VFSAPSHHPISTLVGKHVEYRISNGFPHRSRIINVATDRSGEAFWFIFLQRSRQEINSTKKLFKILEDKTNTKIPLPSLQQLYVICLNNHSFDYLRFYNDKGKEVFQNYNQIKGE
jgi:hypothetical protein